jgi:hypothetical protein
MRKAADSDDEAFEDVDLSQYTGDEDEDDEKYLGEATLAKLRESNLFDESDETKSADTSADTSED